MPGVQNPHCSPCSCLNPSWIGCSSLADARPSTVVTSRPSTCTASIVQDLIALPSTSTVQAPQLVVSQPRCVPVSPTPRRIRSASSSRGSISAIFFLPLIVNLIRRTGNSSGRLVAEVVVDHRHDQAALSASAPVAAVPAPARMRLTKTRTSCRLYSALPR